MKFLDLTKEEYEAKMAELDRAFKELDDKEREFIQKQEAKKAN